MIDNYVNSIESVQLFVYANGSRVSADAAPTATAADLDTGDAVALSAITTTTHPDGFDYYEVSLDPSEVTFTRRVAITWSYVYNGSNYNRTDLVNVVRPYFEPDDLWARHPEFSEAGAEPLTVDQIKQVEKRVRMRINEYCNQKFQDFGVKTKRVRGNGTNALQLPERIYYLESVRSGELVLFERDVNGDVTTNTAVWYEDEPYLITKRGSESPTITFRDKDPIVSTIERTQSLFRSDRLYEVEAKYGFEYLPAEVHEAAIILAFEELQSEDRYRKKNITVLRSADYRMEFGADHHTTTGNVDADTLLNKHVYDGVFVF